MKQSRLNKVIASNSLARKNLKKRIDQIDKEWFQCQQKIIYYQKGLRNEIALATRSLKGGLRRKTTDGVDTFYEPFKSTEGLDKRGCQAAKKGSSTQDFYTNNSHLPPTRKLCRSQKSGQKIQLEDLSVKEKTESNQIKFNTLVNNKDKTALDFVTKANEGEREQTLNVKGSRTRTPKDFFQSLPIIDPGNQQKSPGNSGPYKVSKKEQVFKDKMKLRIRSATEASKTTKVSNFCDKLKNDQKRYRNCRQIEKYDKNNTVQTETKNISDKCTNGWRCEEKTGKNLSKTRTTNITVVRSKSEENIEKTRSPMCLQSLWRLPMNLRAFSTVKDSKLKINKNEEIKATKCRKIGSENRQKLRVTFRKVGTAVIAANKFVNVIQEKKSKKKHNSKVIKKLSMKRLKELQVPTESFLLQHADDLNYYQSSSKISRRKYYVPQTLLAANVQHWHTSLRKPLLGIKSCWRPRSPLSDRIIIMTKI